MENIKGGGVYAATSSQKPLTGRQLCADLGECSQRFRTRTRLSEPETGLS